MTRRIVVLFCFVLFTCSTVIIAGEKQDAHIAYVLKNAKLSKELNAKLKPMLMAYYKEISAAKSSHKQLKEKLGAKEDAGKLTAAECDQYFESKMKQESAQLEVRKKYYGQFKTILSTPQAYKVIKLCDDKVK